jgi:hypothetical protein
MFFAMSLLYRSSKKSSKKMKKELAFIRILVYTVCGESPKRTKTKPIKRT